MVERTEANVANHAWAPEAVLERLQVDVGAGLSGDEAGRRLEQYGPNTIESRQHASVISLLWHQFESPVVGLLAGAGGLAGYYNELEEAVAIAVVLVLSTLIGFTTEFKATRSIEALRALGTHTTRVRRDGRELILPSAQLVPGDIVILDAGDAVPADLRLVECANLHVDESTLTGESVAVSKAVNPVSADARLADQHSMLFKGTALTRGSAVGVVVGTGLVTELGKVSQLVAEAGGGRSPIEIKLARLSAQLVWATLGIAALIAGIGILTGRDALQMAEAAIALAVAAIPEGLPIVATLALARGMWRMAQQHALIERLSAVETLGATTIILTDKTGTLTENQMTVRNLWVESGEVVIEDGDGPPFGNIDPSLAKLLEIAVLCNDAALHSTADAGTGDPMEVALLRVGLQAGFLRPELLETKPVAHKIAFDSTTRMMATVHRAECGFQVAVKGAPEAVLSASRRVMRDGTVRDIVPFERDEWLRRIEDFGGRGLRVLACATKVGDRASVTPFDDLVFLGLIGLEDPARSDVPAAIASCRRAGIRVVMVTGDHKATGMAIARSLGIARDGDRAVDGRELEEMPEQDLRADLDHIAVFARVYPAQKLRIVEAFQSQGHVVAMTGDGVNDAPALARADIGIAMGVSGTEVAKSAARIVLTDDNFATIVKAVEEGRLSYRNLQKVILYLFATSIDEIVVLLGALLLGYPLPLAAVQILWINLVTEGTVTVNLIMEPPEGDEMQGRPRSLSEPLLSRALLGRVALMSAASSISTFGWFAWRLAQGVPYPQVQTETFTMLVACQWFNVLNCESATRSALRLGILRNRWLAGGIGLSVMLQCVAIYWSPMNTLFHTTPVPAAELAAIFGVASFVLWCEEARKLIVRRIALGTTGA
ncbi:calcium-transporting ATPase 1 [mine drainage metagenome]|uniref:Calcium-transporting ATPase 1 n=1 Tax=mine drainage metagenome TaxID=410659 RepID=A0A1J5QDK8_9ZZZZ